MRTRDILRKAAKLIKNGGWLKGTYAKNKYGLRVSSVSKDAVKFCAVGAIRHVIGKDWITSDQYIKIENKVRNLTGQNLMFFNDKYETSQEDVIKLFRKIANGK